MLDGRNAVVCLQVDLARWCCGKHVVLGFFALTYLAYFVKIYVNCYRFIIKQLARVGPDRHERAAEFGVVPAGGGPGKPVGMAQWLEIRHPRDREHRLSVEDLKWGFQAVVELPGLQNTFAPTSS